jgi:Tfp pilus assembly protein PilE
MSYTYNKRQNAEAGFNLIEAAIVLGIVGLIVGGIWAAAAAAYENMRQQSASRNLLAFAQNIRNFYANSNATTVEVNTTNLIRMGLVPQDMVQGTGSMVSPWNTPVTMTNLAVNNTPGFGIQFGDATSTLKQGQCLSLIARNGGVAAGSGLLEIDVNGAAIAQNRWSNPPATTCQTDTNSTGRNYVRFVFSIK